MQRIFVLFMISAGLIVLFVFLSFSFYPPQSKLLKSVSLDPLSAFSTYQNDAYGIKIEYPSSWEKIDFNGEQLLVGFVTTDKHELGLPENVMLQTTESESYNGISAKELANRALLIYKSQIPDFRLITSSPYETPSELETYKIEYSHTSKNLKIDTLEVWTINGDGDDLYRIIFSSDNNEYSTYLKTVNKMIDSFKVEHGLQPASNI
jgi:eukaryotic-like serine/threonine-protein kinase